MQVPQRRQRLSLNTGKRFSSSSMAPNGHSTVQRLHWVQPSRRARRERKVARARMRGAAERGVLDRLDRLQRGAGGVFGGLQHVHRPAHRAGGVDAGAARLVGEADEVRVGEAVLELRHVRALAVVQVEDGNLLHSTSAAWPPRRRLGCVTSRSSRRGSTPEFGTWPVASTTRSASMRASSSRIRSLEVDLAAVAAGSTFGDLALGEGHALLLRAAVEVLAHARHAQVVCTCTTVSTSGLASLKYIACLMLVAQQWPEQ